MCTEQSACTGTQAVLCNTSLLQALKSMPQPVKVWMNICHSLMPFPRNCWSFQPALGFHVHFSPAWPTNKFTQHLDIDKYYTKESLKLIKLRTKTYKSSGEAQQHTATSPMGPTLHSLSPKQPHPPRTSFPQPEGCSWCNPSCMAQHGHCLCKSPDSALAAPRCAAVAVKPRSTQVRLVQSFSSLDSDSCRLHREQPGANLPEEREENAPRIAAPWCCFSCFHTTSFGLLL